MDVCTKTWRGGFYTCRVSSSSTESQGKFANALFQYPVSNAIDEDYSSLTCSASECVILLPMQSCTKIALDFVSPENIQQCLSLTEDFRRLPKNHRAKEDKLEV